MERKRAVRKPARSAGARRKPTARRKKAVPPAEPEPAVAVPVDAAAIADKPAETAPAKATSRLGQLRDSLLELVSEIPKSAESQSALPAVRARSLILQASSKAAVISGTLALPPGLLGLLTILPELRLIWQIQAQLVADIAAAYGKTYQLKQQEMIFCLFRHVASHAVRDIVVRAGQRFLVRRTEASAVERLLQRIGISIAERGAGRAASRLVPVLGAIGIGGYAFYDTTQVGRTAVSLFEKEIVDEAGRG